MNKIYLSRAIKAGLIVGTLDITGALLHYYIKTNKNPIAVLKFVASGVFGKEAFTGGNGIIIAGLVFHYIIAMAFTFLFYWLASKIPAIISNRIISAVLYGIFMWSFMEFVVLRLSNTPKLPLTFEGSSIAILILIVCIGLPLSFLAAKALTKNA